MEPESEPKSCHRTRPPWKPFGDTEDSLDPTCPAQFTTPVVMETLDVVATAATKEGYSCPCFFVELCPNSEPRVGLSKRHG